MGRLVKVRSPYMEALHGAHDNASMQLEGRTGQF